MTNEQSFPYLALGASPQFEVEHARSHVARAVSFVALLSGGFFLSAALVSCKAFPRTDPSITLRGAVATSFSPHSIEIPGLHPDAPSRLPKPLAVDSRRNTLLDDALHRKLGRPGRRSGR